MHRLPDSLFPRTNGATVKPAAFFFLMMVGGGLLLLTGGGPFVGAAPITEPGLHVLQIYNADQNRDLTPAKLSAVSSNRVPDYVDKKGGKFKRFDVSTEQKNMDAVWVEAMKRKRGELPWVIVSNAPYKGGFEGPLPETDDACLTLVKKYGE